MPRDLLAIDYETDAIQGNPTVRPPKPVGVSLKRPGFKSRYFAWGHPEGNNCEGPQEAQNIIAESRARGDEWVFHNAKFDLSVQEMHLGIKPPDDPLRVHDTMYSIFLNDPYEANLSLKPSAERILGLPPDEQDDLKNWILTNIAGATPKNFGAFIALAPAGIVEPYAKGDTDRTLKIHQKLYGEIPQAAYQREQRLLPVVMDSERMGILCDRELLEKEMAAQEKALIKADNWIYKFVGKDGFNIGSGDELADALEEAGLVTEWVLTPTGKRSTARDALEAVIKHPELLAILRYRGALSHCLSNFGRPWIALAREYNGRLHPEWNQVRQSRDERENKGARTGRVTCSRPNFTNPPNVYTIEVPKGYPELPVMRKYLLADEGYIWLKRDYSQQEFRILAHYSEGRLYERYKENPRIDAHDETKGMIQEYAGIELERKDVKITGFSIIYGSGIPHLSQSLGVHPNEARATRDAFFTALPEVPQLMRTCQDVGRRGDCITTWGGRKYFVEPPRILVKGPRKGQRITFEYKLLNYLIQGSAADCTKEALIRWHGNRGQGQLLSTVYDEIDIQAPVGRHMKDMKLLTEAMESIEFDVPMLSDGSKGRSWAQLEDCK